MIEQLKAKWLISPWYIRLGLPLLAILLLFLKGKDAIAGLYEAVTRNRVDRRARELEASENSHKSDAERISNTLDELNRQKADALKKAEKDASTEFHNNR